MELEEVDGQPRGHRGTYIRAMGPGSGVKITSRTGTVIQRPPTNKPNKKKAKEPEPEEESSDSSD